MVNKTYLDLEIRRTVEKTNSVDENSRLKTELRNLFVCLLRLKRSDHSYSLVCNKTMDVMSLVSPDNNIKICC